MPVKEVFMIFANKDGHWQMAVNYSFECLSYRLKFGNG